MARLLDGIKVDLSSIQSHTLQASVLRHENTSYGEAALTKIVSNSAEPWRFGIEPGEVASFVAAYGFAVSHHKGAQELEAAYFQDADGRLVGRINGTHRIVTAVRQ